MAGGRAGTGRGRGRRVASAAGPAALGTAGLLVASLLDLSPGAAAVVRRPAPPSAAPPAAPAGSLETPGANLRLSVGAKDEQLSGPSTSPSISADGRYTVFRSALVVSGIDVGVIDLRDATDGSTTEISRGSVVIGVAVVASVVSDPVIAGDGNTIAFVTGPPNSAPGRGRIALWDRSSGQVGSPFPAATNPQASDPALSFDGRVLAFRTPQPLVRADVNGLDDVYAFDRSTGSFELVSVGPNGQNGRGGVSGQPSVSADGQRIAFSSSALGLVSLAATAPPPNQVYLRDRTAGTTALLSAAPDGSAGNRSSVQPSISGTGDVVAFASLASNLVPGDGNGVEDVFAWQAGAPLARISLGRGGEANAASDAPSVSADGGSIAFESQATNLVPGDANDVGDVFVRDLVIRRTSRVSVGRGTSEANGPSSAPSISATGRFVAFASDAGNLVAGDTNQVTDVFRRDRTPAITFSPSPVDFGVVNAGAAPSSRTVKATSTGASAVAVSAATLADGAPLGFSISADGCAGKSLHPGQSCQIVVAFKAVAAGPATGSLAVGTDIEPAPRTVGLTALVLGGTTAPRIVLSPTVGPPGTVVTVTGTGFAAGQPVAFTWSPGITPTPVSPIAAGPDGSLTAQVLVLPNDLLGPRSLGAASVVGGSPGPPAKATFLVTAHTAAPPVSPVLRVVVPGTDRPIIDRG